MGGVQARLVDEHGATALDTARGLPASEWTANRRRWRTLCLPEIVIKIQIFNADNVIVHEKVLTLVTLAVEDDDDATAPLYAPVEVDMHGKVQKRGGVEKVIYTSILDEGDAHTYSIDDKVFEITNKAFGGRFAFEEMHLPSIGEGSSFCLVIDDLEMMKATPQGGHMGPPKIKENAECIVSKEDESGGTVQTRYTVHIDATLVNNNGVEDPGEDDSATFTGGDAGGDDRD